MKFRFLSVLLTALTLGSVRAAGDLSDMRGLELNNVKIPFYKGKKPQVVIFSATGVRQDNVLLSSQTYLDVLLENADVDRITDGWKVRLYGLNAPLDQVLAFWKPKVATSQAVLFTPRSSIDRSRGEAFGDDPVYMRSPVLDLDGLGFQADFRHQTLEVTSEVRIVARKSDSDPRKLLTGAPRPKQYEVIHAEADALRLDQLNNELMLIGNVKVVDGPTTLTCDRLTVFLSDEDNSPGDAPEVPMLKGVSRVLADGDVVMVKRPDAPGGDTQTAKSEHLEYVLKSGIITLTGDNREPEIAGGDASRLSGRRIEMLRHQNRVFVTGNCRLVTRSAGKEGEPASERSIASERADFDNNARTGNFYGKVKASEKDTELYCDHLRIVLKPDRNEIAKAFADRNVKIVSRNRSAEPPAPAAAPAQKAAASPPPEAKPAAPPAAPSTLTAEQGELNYLTDKLIFYRNVKVRDGVNALDCDRLDLFLKKRPASAPAAAAPVNPPGSAFGGGDLTLTKLTAAGNVFMTNNRDEMHTELMTLFFRDLPEGVKPTPGMFQSGGVQLIRIVCDGKVVGVSKDAPDSPAKHTLNAEHGMWDLLKDYSEFHRDVAVYSGKDEALFCRDMYVFTQESNPEGDKGVNVRPATDPLDADPFALDMGENSVPARIALSDGLNLKRIVCQNEVVIVKRGSDGKLQRAGGDKAVYTVLKKELVMTAEPPRRPWLRSDGRKQFCDRIVSDTETEDLRGIGNVQVMPDTGK